MGPIRIRTMLSSDTPHLPELQPLIGRTVEIIVRETSPDTPSEQFYAELARFADSEIAFAAQKETFHAWRADHRFSPYWSMLDHLLTRSFTDMRKWADVLGSVQGVTDYDYDAVPEMDARDILDQRQRNA